MIAFAIALLIFETLLFAGLPYALLRWKRPPETIQFAVGVASMIAGPFFAFGAWRMLRVL